MYSDVRPIWIESSRAFPFVFSFKWRLLIHMTCKTILKVVVYNDRFPKTSKYKRDGGIAIT